MAGRAELAEDGGMAGVDGLDPAGVPPARSASIKAVGLRAAIVGPAGDMEDQEPAGIGRRGVRVGETGAWKAASSPKALA